MHILTTKSSKDYELIDSGDGQKLERYGKVVLSRPDPQALWPKLLSRKEWDHAKGVFTRVEGQKGGVWKMTPGTIEEWDIELNGLNFWIKPTSFKHTGVFPEQVGNWKWMQEKIAEVKDKKELSVLNLFGYTGGATLACAKAGAKVTHVDASKSAITWANDNAELSGLKEAPIRWILEDAMAFVKREIKRGNKYDAIIMDPPAFGRGVKGEVWKIEEDFLPFLELSLKLLSDKPLFFIINGYASGYSALAYENNLKALEKQFGGHIESGELTIEESRSGRLLPCGIFSRWSK